MNNLDLLTSSSEIIFVNNYDFCAAITCRGVRLWGGEGARPPAFNKISKWGGGGGAAPPVFLAKFKPFANCFDPSYLNLLRKSNCLYLGLVILTF